MKKRGMKFGHRRDNREEKTCRRKVDQAVTHCDESSTSDAVFPSVDDRNLKGDPLLGRLFVGDDNLLSAVVVVAPATWWRWVGDELDTLMSGLTWSVKLTGRLDIL